MMDRNMSRKQKGKVFDSCVVPVSTYGSDIEALSVQQQSRLRHARTKVERLLKATRLQKTTAKKSGLSEG